MALVSSPIRFSGGSLEDMSFYKDKRGRCIARMKRGRIPDFHTHPKYERCRENSSEFTITSNCVRQLRKAFIDEIPYCSEGTYFNRLMGLMKLVLNTDPTADRGARSCYLGNLNLMREYEFNGQRPLSETLNADFYAHINASTGHMEVEISPFCPLRDLNPPAGAKYFQLFIRGAAVNSEGKHSERAIAPFLPITSDETDTINLNIKVNAQEGDIQALALGIIFYEEYMGAPSAMRNGSLALVQVARLDPQVLKATAHKPGYAPKSIDSAINTLGTTFKKAFRFNDPFGLAKDPVHAPAFKKAEEKLKQTLWHHQLQRYRRG